jgi:cytochrome c peroxidase
MIPSTIPLPPRKSCSRDYTDLTENPLSRRRAGAASFGRAGLLALSLTFAVSQALGGGESESGADALRDLLSRQAHGLQNLQVPARNEDLPIPRQADGTVASRIETTEAKRYLGKLLFHDPVRTARVDINQGQPVDLPAGTAFGGTVDASNPNIANIVAATKQTGSCGSCHIGEAAGKAGQVLNFNVGGEGRGYTDEDGNFFPRRRVQSNLTPQRSAPIFSGDVLVDALPTLTDIDLVNGTRLVTTPANFHHTPLPDALLATGRLDELDSVAREAPGLVGVAFNNRLLFGGFGGEPQSTIGSLNPFNDPAAENLTLLLLDAHRMLNFQSAELLKIPAFVKLFRDAFPQEAAQSDAQGDPTILVNDQTELRAQATFLRTIVTRNTPFDRFLAGDNNALTPAERRGAQLFFTPATGGAGGAGCATCHSGPMMNKQNNDPDVAGIGAFIEENFINVGIGDHPVRALDALARGHLDPAKLGKDGFPYHAEDVGRQEVTRNPTDAFRFRSLTMRQLKDGRTFFHNASFTKIRDVVEYFNAGVPQDLTAAAAPTLDPRFTNPRGPGSPRGVGLSEQQVDDITAFLTNALYDPALVKFDPASSTDTLQPNVRDLTYSKYRPDLAALGAKDGFMLSGLAIDDNDHLTRRDEGLEFLDVTSQATVSSLGDRQDGNAFRITNSGTSVIDTNLIVMVSGVPRGVRLLNASGTTSAGDPFIRLFLRNGVLNPGDSVNVRLRFAGDASKQAHPFSFVLLSGQGKP